MRAALRALAAGSRIELRQAEDRRGRAEASSSAGRGTSVVPPVVDRVGRQLEVPFTVPAERDARGRSVTAEGGGTIRAHGRLFELAADSHAWPGGVVHCMRRAKVCARRRARLSPASRGARRGRRGRRTRDRRADAGAWGSPGQRAASAWGVFAPVYGLASPRAARPVISARCAGCSSGRRRAAGATSRRCRSSRRFSTSRSRSRRTRRRAGCSGTSCISICARSARSWASRCRRATDPAPALIDYRAQYAWRRAGDRRVAATFLADRARAEIGEWAAKHGVYDYAAFRAIGEAQRTGWRDWPAPLRDDVPGSRPARGDRARRRCRARRHATSSPSGRCRAARARSHGGPVALYLDLPVGVNMRCVRGLALAPAVPARSRPARRPMRCSSAARTGGCRRCRRSRCVAAATSTSSTACAITWRSPACCGSIT